ncbi:nSTAND1 domain-containing NTPase [Sphingomonas desiccabilis]|uniref:AAA family ATPase n=1 Tax=Sphingomonas desiccabilis TaxID=429134 RepID=A0A4Q2IYE4_9SPHN|nr:AAA family ATPase [Sphingomonas desiccabilis]MBB3909529.1 Cdc6-like AAA superfamily ATPase [Sphingomonas desiccabilis]RXZ34254.1 AAA family ATPase [Sphingomonas desiccabilis]
MTEPDFHQLYALAGSTFTPGTPVNDRDLFAGRLDQLSKVSDAVMQLGYHAVLFGDRGVGKTSLSNVISAMKMGGRDLATCKVTCDASDTFSSLWKKAFQDLSVITVQPAFGFGQKDSVGTISLESNISENASPNDVRVVLKSISEVTDVLIIFDEFDRITAKAVTGLMADTIKALSDSAIRSTILIVGVAESVDSLIENHASVERALVQVALPRMSKGEIGQIIDKGLDRLGMKVGKKPREELVTLSQGLPYITHLLGLHVARAALLDARLEIAENDLGDGIKTALDQWQQSIKSAHYKAVLSSQPGNIFQQVLLACAMAETDDFGYFTATSVKAPLRSITGKDYDIPSFSNHLKEFSEVKRGKIIERVGQTRRFRYRFVSPLMKPYVVMKGFSDGLLNRESLTAS